MKMRNKKTDIVLLLQLMILSMVIISSDGMKGARACASEYPRSSRTTIA